MTTQTAPTPASCIKVACPPTYKGLPSFYQTETSIVRFSINADGYSKCSSPGNQTACFADDFDGNQFMCSQMSMCYASTSACVCDSICGCTYASGAKRLILAVNDIGSVAPSDLTTNEDFVPLTYPVYSSRIFYTNPSSSSTNPISSSTNPISRSTNPISSSTNPISSSTNPISSKSTNPFTKTKTTINTDTSDVENLLLFFMPIISICAIFMLILLILFVKSRLNLSRDFPDKENLENNNVEKANQYDQIPSKQNTYDSPFSPLSPPMTLPISTLPNDDKKNVYDEVVLSHGNFLSDKNTGPGAYDCVPAIRSHYDLPPALQNHYDEPFSPI